MGKTKPAEAGLVGSRILFKAALGGNASARSSRQRINNSLATPALTPPLLGAADPGHRRTGFKFQLHDHHDARAALKVIFCAG
jgi:hypothetical protein